MADVVPWLWAFRIAGGGYKERERGWHSARGGCGHLHESELPNSAYSLPLINKFLKWEAPDACSRRNVSTQISELSRSTCSMMAF